MAKSAQFLLPLCSLKKCRSVTDKDWVSMVDLSVLSGPCWCLLQDIVVYMLRAIGVGGGCREVMRRGMVRVLEKCQYGGRGGRLGQVEVRLSVTVHDLGRKQAGVTVHEELSDDLGVSRLVSI